MDANRLHFIISQCAPIDGVSVGNPSDKATWRIDFRPEATDSQKSAAQSALEAFDPNAKPIPKTVSRMQAMVALSRAGMLSNAQTWINTQSAEVQLVWNSASEFSRNSGTLTGAASALGLTSDQVDALFVTASEINP